MGPVLNKNSLKAVKHKFVVSILLSLFCLVLLTNIYFMCNITIDIPSSHEIQETSGQQWHRDSLVLSKEDIQKALAAGHRNASLWGEEEILKAVKRLPRKYFKTDVQGIATLKEKMNFHLRPQIQSQLSQGELKFALSLTQDWSNRPKDMTIINSILSALCAARVLKAETSTKGTQLKLMLMLEGGFNALFKPQWYKRDEALDGPVYAGRDRHNAEVAAFYLAMILGMHRIPYVVGRRINVKREIMPVADRRLLETFVQNSSHICFYGNCPLCDPLNAVCSGKHLEESDINQGKDLLEGALILMLPSTVRLKKYRHPWQRTYNNLSAYWEVQADYCDIVKRSRRYFTERNNRLLSLIDTSIFDFLIDNGDRHHYEIVENSDIDEVLLIDNGKGFGNPLRDHIDILAPLYQCCILRSETYQTLLSLRGNELSKLMRKVQRNSHISPLLTEAHLIAMDRRLTLVFAAIEVCFKNYGESKVLKKPTN